MQLQRNYTLPNCTLSLEGMSDPSSGLSAGSPMTILTNAVCQFLGQESVLSGGSEFFSSLVATASRYAQEQLSGLRSRITQEGLVRMQRLENGRHEVSVYDADGDSIDPDSVQTAELTTVQLFDLVEAIDQFLADSTALPALKQGISPLAKRDVPSQEPMTQRIAAPAIGGLGLAIAAAALFALPLPNKIEQPPAEGGASIEAVREEDEQGGNDDTGASGGGGGTNKPKQELGEGLLNDNLITDEVVLGAIGADLENQINDAWVDPLGLDEDISYRITTSQDGTVLGYVGLSQLAKESVSKTPLKEKLYIPAEGGSVEDEPLAQFKMTFTADDKLKVEPFTPEDLGIEVEPPPEEEGSESSGSTPGLIDAEEISDWSEVDRLADDLYDRLDKEWKDSIEGGSDLEYRVQVSSNGDVVGFEAITEPARIYGEETPLHKIAKPGKADQVAEIKVVFGANDSLEVSAW